MGRRLVEPTAVFEAVVAALGTTLGEDDVDRLTYDAYCGLEDGDDLDSLIAVMVDIAVHEPMELEPVDLAALPVLPLGELTGVEPEPRNGAEWVELVRCVWTLGRDKGIARWQEGRGDPDAKYLPTIGDVIDHDQEGGPR